MNSTNNVIAKNIFVLMGSQVTTWTLTLLLTVFLPRYLGPAGIGKLQFATSLWLVVGMMIAFGTGTLLTKEIARVPQRTSELFGSVVVVRTVLFLIGYAATIALLRALNYPPETIVVVAIIGAANLMEQFATACQSSLQGLERMGVMSVANIVGKSIDTVIGILLLLSGWGIYAIAGLLIVSTTVRFLIQLRYLKQGYPLQLSFQVDTAVRMLRSGLPYLMSSIFLVGYLQMNVLILSFLLNEETIGWYAAAERLFNTLLFIPTIFMMAVFPVFSRLKMSDTAYLHRLMGKSFDSLLLLGVPIGLGMTIVSGPIVTFLFGQEFANSGPILGVLGIALIFMYLNVLLGQFMISIDRQNTWTTIMAVATVILIVLDVTLIPWSHARWGNGAIGGALSYCLTELGMVVTGIILLPPGTLRRSNGWTALRIFLAGFIMAGVAWWLSGYLIIVPIVAGAVVYGLLILAMQVVPREDIRLAVSTVQQLFRRQSAPAPEAVA